MGRPFGTPGEPVRHFVSRRGHSVRSLSCDGDADYAFAQVETAEAILERVQRDWPVDLLVCWCPEVVPPPRNLEACPVRTAAVVSDWTVYYPQLEHNLLRYDVVATDALGAEITGADLSHVGELEFEALHEALLEHQVVFFRDQ